MLMPQSKQLGGSGRDRHRRVSLVAHRLIISRPQVLSFGTPPLPCIRRAPTGIFTLTSYVHSAARHRYKHPPPSLACAWSAQPLYGGVNTFP